MIGIYEVCDDRYFRFAEQAAGELIRFETETIAPTITQGPYSLQHTLHDAASLRLATSRVNITRAGTQEVESWRGDRAVEDEAARCYAPVAVDAVDAVEPAPICRLSPDVNLHIK